MYHWAFRPEVSFLRGDCPWETRGFMSGPPTLLNALGKGNFGIPCLSKNPLDRTSHRVEILPLDFA